MVFQHFFSVDITDVVMVLMFAAKDDRPNVSHCSSEQISSCLRPRGKAWPMLW